MTEQSWSDKSELRYERADVLSMILIPVSVRRCARIAVAPCVRHYDIESILKGSCEGSPTRSIRR